MTVSKLISTDEAKKKFKISYLLAAISIVLFLGVFYLIRNGDRLGGAPKTFRYSFMLNEKIWSLLQSNKRLNTTSPVSPKKWARVNGLIGLKTTIDISENYKIEILQDNQRTKLTLSELFALPKRSYTSEFRCIEGWSEDTQYAGARFSEFMEAHHLGKKSDGSYYSYVGLETPDGQYYVSIDMESMLHPQTILAWERNYKPLTQNNGQPIRLLIPIKYGIKSLKRIGKIVFSDVRPKDYWAERGYDWYSGL